MAGGFTEDYEDLTNYRLDAERERELVKIHNECVFIWANRQGDPVGVIMSYVARDGKFYLTAAAHRKRIAAVRRDPRCSLVITSTGTPMGPGKTVTYKGRCVVHDDNKEIKKWFYPALAEALYGPAGPAKVKQFASMLDSPDRVIVEMTTEKTINFDGDKMAAATPPVE